MTQSSAMSLVEAVTNVVVGYVLAIATQIVSYYFGSSQGSKDKADQLKEALK